MLKVERLINRNFDNYAIQLTTKPDKHYISWDGSCSVTWISKKDALKLAAEIRRIFPPLHHD